ncbi:MAG: RnfABCDGE type electron transport complex subunit C, partial [Oscillospiraceae bacterium]|nr:RnfABCDGE type electron transport complex subunit C [Oscillospiraceae bacterium]
MKSFKFHGGAHPRYNKRQSQYFKIEDIGAPAQVILPVLQHIGKPAKPIVKQGDRVLFGQKIAEGQGDVSASVHSSVSGIVEKIAPHVHPGGEVVSSIFIKNDFKNLKHPSIKPRRHFSELTASEIVASVREAGVVGMGGAAFPTHVKLAPQPDKKVKNLIINGCECEPYLTSDHRVMLEYPEKLVLGILAISRVVTPERIYIAIEDNKKDAIETMQQYTKEIENIEVVRLPTRYPQG